MLSPLVVVWGHLFTLFFGMAAAAVAGNNYNGWSPSRQLTNTTIQSTGCCWETRKNNKLSSTG